MARGSATAFNVAIALSKAGANVTNITRDSRHDSPKIDVDVGNKSFCISVEAGAISFMMLKPKFTDYKSVKDVADLKKQIGIA